MTHARRLVFGLVLLAASPALAGSPTVESVIPGIGQVGTRFDVVLGGAGFKDARDLLLYDPGLACTRLEVVSDNEVRATLQASADCRPGAHPFRLRTPQGLSELKVVHVTPFPVVAEVEPNDEPKAAQVVPLNTAVAGVIESGDVDGVAVALRKGQRLAAEVQAVRLGGEFTDSTLTILDPDGRPVAHADDTFLTRQDPFAAIVAPRDGTYTVRVRDTAFGGGPANTYALYVGDFPRPSWVVPPGGQSGERARLTLGGVAAEPAVQALDLPKNAAPWWDYYPNLGGTAAPTPIAIRLRPYPCAEESSSAGDRVPHDWPVAFHGVIGTPDEADSFAIRAREGETIQVEAFAERVGSPLDTILEVFDPEGELVARNDDDESLDSRIIFRTKAAGAHRIAIRDKRGKGGPGSIYRIEVEWPRPGLTLFLAGPVRKSQARQTIAVPRGNRVVAFLGARRDGFDGPVRVQMGSLPEGVSADLTPIPAASHLTPVVFEAKADAPLGASLVELEGVASTPGGTVTGGFRQVVDLIPGPGDSSFASVVVGRLAVVVVEPAPYTVSLAPPVAPLARDGAIDLMARVERVGGFDEAIEVSLPYLPPGVEMDGPGIIPPGQSEAVLRLAARPDADPVAWRLAAEARPAPPRRDRREMTLALMTQLDPQAGGRRRRRSPVEGLPQVASRFVPIDLTSAPFAGRFASVACEQGKAVTVTCSLDPGLPPGRAMMATLEGLPPRAEALPVDVRPGARSVEFKVSLAPDTPVGEHETLLCQLSDEVGGRAVIYRVGRGGRLAVTPPGGIVAGADGRPLSPLDALRLKERGEKKPAKGPGAKP
jgi:hypothetical protein